METVNIVLNYGPNDGVEVLYKITKTFKFKKIPAIACDIALIGEPIKSVYWKRPEYNPTLDEYTLIEECCKRVGRYKFSPQNVMKLIKQTLKEFEKAGWDVKKISKIR